MEGEGGGGRLGGGEGGGGRLGGGGGWWREIRWRGRVVEGD